MSRDPDRLRRKPLIAVVDRANRALQSEMVDAAHAGGFTGARYSHNSVFGFLWDPEGERTVDLAQRAGITRQSMGEIVRAFPGDSVAVRLHEAAKLLLARGSQVGAAADERFRPAPRLPEPRRPLPTEENGRGRS